MPITRPRLLDIAEQRTDLSEQELAYIQLLLSDWTLLADLSFSDLILWLPTWNEAGFVAAAQIRPSTSRTYIPEDLVGHFVPRGRHHELDRAIANAETTSGPRGQENELTQVIPVINGDRVIALLGRYSGTPGTGRMESIYAACSNELFQMVANGEFPTATNNDQGTGGRGGAPRVGDGLILLDGSGVIEYASPNARSAFRRLGVAVDIEGEVLADLANRLNRRGIPINDTLSLVVRGRIQGTAEIEAAQAAATVRSIPLRQRGASRKTLILMRDVSDLRRREQALLGKDAAIREIHHRVKNNLQTVASLLRIQGRRLTDSSAQAALAEAGRRVATIAVVHDLLAHNPNEMVDFDEVANRVVTLTVETSVPVKVHLSNELAFGWLPTEQASPLALAVAELVANAVEHGSSGRDEVSIRVCATRTADNVQVSISDDGAGINLPVDSDGGLGLAIVMTLVNDELDGQILFAHNNQEGNLGTTVTINFPLISE